MVVYFSGTGNSKYVAERIAGSLQEKLLCMNERIKSGDTGTVKTGENLVVVVPTYAWRIPRVVSDWIGQTEFVGAKNVWYVMSCGSGIGGADIYNRKLSEKKGLKHMGTAQIIMPENYIAMFNAPDVEKAKKIVAAAGPDIAKAALAIKHGEKLPSKSGFGASFKSGLVNDIFYVAFVKAKAFYADQTCTGCGKCVKVCPLNNVTMKNKKPFYVMAIVIIIMYAVIYILRPALVSGQPVSGVLKQITPVAPVQQPETTPSQEYTTCTIDIAEEEYWDSLELLAICVEAEAGNQSLEGKRLVADVILNRAEDHSGQWPDTISGVKSQKDQFTSYWDGGMAGIWEPSEETYQAVKMEVEQRGYPGIYYFREGQWSDYGTPWRKTGAHYFSKK